MTDASPHNASDTPHRKPAITHPVSWLLIVVVYFLSPAPVEWSLEKLGVLRAVQRTLLVVYWPIDFVSDRVAWIERFYDWEYRLFGL